MIILPVFFLGITGACWGSFLYVLAQYLMLQRTTLNGRSFCPCCNHYLVWYDLIPLVSWLMLQGNCRYCKNQISWLYPAVEVLTALLVILLFTKISVPYCYTYFIFFSALIITIITDLQYMLISQFVSIYLVPLALCLSGVGWLDIPLFASIMGAIGGYVGLSSIASLFKVCTGKEGLGKGDIELMSCIGAFTGLVGCWTTLFAGSIAGSCVGIIYMIVTGTSESVKIPFGPFLALGAIVHVLYNKL